MHCVVTRPLTDPAPAVIETQLPDPDATCSACGRRCGYAGDLGYIVTGLLICAACVTDDERAAAVTGYEAAADDAAGDACLQRGVHTSTCPGDACTGCAPTPAAAGQMVCVDHINELYGALRAFPELWAALGDLGRAGDTAGAPGRSQQVLPPAIEARSLIRATLVSWCRALEDDHDIALPDEALLARRTLVDVVTADYDRDVARHAARRTRDTTRRAQLHATATGHQQRAGTLRDRRAGDVDVIDGLREHLTDHVRLLLAPAAPDVAERAGRPVEHAQLLVEDVLDVHARAHAVAHPTTRPARFDCPACGARVSVDVDRVREYACPGCGDARTVDGWRALVNPGTTAPLPLRELPDWLLANRRLRVTYEQLRTWRDRGHLHAIPHDADGAPIPTGVTFTGPVTYRYDPEAVALVARARLGERRAG